jgi:hypothetical protein
MLCRERHGPTPHEPQLGSYGSRSNPACSKCLSKLKAVATPSLRIKTKEMQSVRE